MRLIIKSYISADATPKIKREIQGDNRILDTNKINTKEDWEKYKQETIDKFISKLWNKGDKKTPSGRPDLKKYAKVEGSGALYKRLLSNFLNRLFMES